MSLIKIGSLILNTDAIASIDLDAPHPFEARGKSCVYICLTASSSDGDGLIAPHWHFFVDEEAEMLRRFFTHGSQAIDLAKWDSTLRYSREGRS